MLALILLNNLSELAAYQNLTSKEGRFTTADCQLKR
jgi:hypothetical protein